jgi:hypothetical protein
MRPASVRKPIAAPPSSRKICKRLTALLFRPRAERKLKTLLYNVKGFFVRRLRSAGLTGASSALFGLLACLEGDDPGRVDAFGMGAVGTMKDLTGS